jgi:hypothetical protein
VSDGDRSYSPLWLRNFLFALFAVFLFLAVSLWLYNWRKDAQVFDAMVALQSEGDEALARVLDTFDSPHLFAGYETYHGFGPDWTPKMYDRARAIVAAGRDYTSPEMDWLAHQVAFTLPALREVKVEGKVPFVEGDRLVLLTVVERWENAVHAGWLMAAHLTLVTFLLGLVAWLYARFRLWERLR